MEKIICGGFELGEGLQMDGNVLNVTSSGGGLPPVTGSGKALVSVNGEWVEQDGYGWVEAGGMETLADEAVSVEISELFSPYPTGLFSEGFNLVVGDTYNVTIDGTEYPNLVADGPDDTAYIVDGNIETMVDVTFSICMTPFGTTISFIDASKVGSFSVKVEHVAGETVHKIDSKYLPESGGVVIARFEENTETGDFECSMTSDELKDAFNNGAQVVLIHTDGIDDRVYTLQKLGYFDLYFMTSYYKVIETVPYIVSELAEVDNIGRVTRWSSKMQCSLMM